MISQFAKLFIFCTSLLMVAGYTYGQEEEAPTEEVKKVKATVTKKKFSQMHFGYQTWQESIDANSGATASTMLTHFHGVRLGYSWHRPHKNVRWLTVYGTDFGFGVVKGAAASPLTDEVENQMWFSATFNPGWMYRTTSKSELGFFLPLAYRRIQWDVTAPFELDKENSFSAGLTLAYVNRFNLKNSFMATITHQFVWNATVFGLGYQIDLR